MKRGMVLLCWACAAMPAWAVNKCVNPDGQVVYQAAPCPDTAKSAEVAIQKAPPIQQTLPESDEVKTMQRKAALLQSDRKILETQRQISSYRQAMDEELNRLKRQKLYANNNLAGATWEQSISDEMNAVTKKYEVLIQAEQSRLDALQRDADQLRKEDKPTP